VVECVLPKDEVAGSNPVSRSMKTHAFRLKPNENLRDAIDRFVQDNNISAGAILTCVGSLSSVTLRMAGAKEIKTYTGEFEIVSLTGTVSQNGCHLHLAISNEEGTVLGGHLKNNAIIRTTAEVVIAELQGKTFRREPDPLTGFEELVVS
jgi:uncharacterized protein